MKFTASVIPSGNAWGVEVPDTVMNHLDAGPRPPVVVQIHGHLWRTRIARMRGQVLVGISGANAQASGIRLGETVEIDISLDAEPRVVQEP